MPLHLLGKKSWNVYNASAIAKVRADEARSAAREEAQNELELTYQADVRLALLGGLPEPPRPAELDIDVEAEYESGRRREPTERLGREERQRKRKRVGEDDTDMELRIAKEEMDGREKRAVVGRRSEGGREERKEKHSLPLVGKDGHIQLFAPASPSGPAHDARQQNPEEVLRKKQQEEREGGAMRFDAAGGNRSNPARTPWYAGRASEVAGLKSFDDEKNGEPCEAIGKDAWGNEDAGRKSRDAMRMSTADPMAMMQMAQRKLKAVEREREAWKKERGAEVGLAHEATSSRRSREHDTGDERRHRSRASDNRTKRRGHDRHCSRSRSRERRHSHHRRRSRSRSPDREHHRRQHSIRT